MPVFWWEKWRRPLCRGLVLALLLALAVSASRVAIHDNLRNWNKVPRVPSWEGVEAETSKNHEKIYDIDTHLIHTGFLQALTLHDTLRWWTGT